MAKKKSNVGKIILVALGVLLAGGAAATIAAGALTDWTFGINDAFSDVKIESQTVVYDGTAKKLSIELPEGATYELTITDSEGEVVSEAKDIGVYEFAYKVTIGEETREYHATLTIEEEENQVEEKVEAQNMNLKLKAVNLLADGAVAKVFTYSITPENATNKSINVSVAWAGNDSSSQDDDNNTYSLSEKLSDNFESKFMNTFPPDDFRKGEYAARRSVTINDETVYVNAYEPLVVAIDDIPHKPEPLSTVLKGIDIFQKDGNTYTAQYTLEMEEPTASTTYIILTFNGTKYHRARMNNERFSVSDISAYIQNASRAGEFLPEEGDVLSGSPSIGFFAGCSFAFEDYTTRRTISHAVRSII